MVMCFVPDCTHHSVDDRCRFYRFPSKEEDKKRWEQLISRTDRSPSRYSLVCSCHFVGGLKANGPTIFMSFSQSTDRPGAKKRRYQYPRSTPRLEKKPLKITPPELMQDETTLSAHEDVNSPPSSPKSLSSISEILETQLYYFDDDVSLVSQPQEDGLSLQGAPMKRFDITQPPKRSSLSIVEHKGVKYVVENSQNPRFPPNPIFQRKVDSILDPSVPVIRRSEPIKIAPRLPTMVEKVPGKLLRTVGPQINPPYNEMNQRHTQLSEDNVSSFVTIPKIVQPTVKLEVTSDNQNKCVPKIPPVTNALLEAQLYFLEEDVKKLKTENEYLKARFCYASIADNDELVIMYTGLPSAEIFQLLLSFCTSLDFFYFYDWKVERIKVEDQLLMTLMKLRRNESQVDLRVRFNCSLGMVNNIILTWLHLLHEVLFQGLMRRIPSILKNRACLPSCFSDFSGCRMALEMAEVHCTDSKQRFKNNHVTHSHFKKGCAVKGLVGVAPSGVVTFCSKLYSSSVTDDAIFKDSGLIEVLDEGDLLLCEKSFSIGHLLPKGVLLNTPPSVSMPDLTPMQILQARSIARTRIHVERALCRIKGFAVLDLIPQMLRPYSSIVWQVCAALSNLQHPLIKEIEAFY